MEYLKNILNNIVFQTVISGTLIFLIGECIQKFVLTPIVEHKKIIAKIDNKLKYYSNVILNPPTEHSAISQDTYDGAKEILRKLSCDLESTYKMIPFKEAFSYLGLVSCKKQISDSATDLIALYNLTGQKVFPLEVNGKKTSSILWSLEKVGDIRKNLKIESYENS